MTTPGFRSMKSQRSTLDLEVGMPRRECGGAGRVISIRAPEPPSRPRVQGGASLDRQTRERKTVAPRTEGERSTGVVATSGATTRSSTLVARHAYRRGGTGEQEGPVTFD